MEGELDDYKKELSEERKKLDSYGKSINNFFIIIKEFERTFDLWREGKGEFMECRECGGFRGEKIRD